MKFENRVLDNPRKKKITNLSTNEVYDVEVDEADNNVITEGTPINAEVLSKGNWRDDDSLSFMHRIDDKLPDSKAETAQIVSKSNGEVWLVKANGKGTCKLSNCINTEPDYDSKWFVVTDTRNFVLTHELNTKNLLITVDITNENMSGKSEGTPADSSYYSSRPNQEDGYGNSYMSGFHDYRRTLNTVTFKRGNQYLISSMNEGASAVRSATGSVRVKIWGIN